VVKPEIQDSFLLLLPGADVLEALLAQPQSSALQTFVHSIAADRHGRELLPAARTLQDGRFLAPACVQGGAAALTVPRSHRHGTITDWADAGGD
jgi:hypothetical protein